MKVSFKNLNKDNNAKRFIPPAIPLERAEEKEIKKTDCLSLKLRTNPNDGNSQTYELTIKFFNNGTPEEWLVFVRNVKRVFTGQNITQGPGKYAMVRRLLLGDTLAAFEKAATAIGAENNANFDLVMREVTTHVFPRRALTYQKRYMRRHMRKPKTMTTREFAARVAELNAYLKDFPPFANNQELPEEEVLDLLEFGVPNSWQKNMVLQGFEPLNHTASEFVAFCERHEFTEGSLDNSEKNVAKPKPSPKGGDDRKSGAKSSVEAHSNKKRKHSDKWCDLHQTHGHDTSECKVVQAQIQKMRQSWEPVRHNKNKMEHSKKGEKDKKEHLMSLVKEGIKSYIKTKKQKQEKSYKVAEEKEEISDFDIEDFNNLEVEDSESESSNDE
jgi:hypothetical protein